MLQSAHAVLVLAAKIFLPKTWFLPCFKNFCQQSSCSHFGSVLIAVYLSQIMSSASVASVFWKRSGKLDNRGGREFWVPSEFQRAWKGETWHLSHTGLDKKLLVYVSQTSERGVSPHSLSPEQTIYLTQTSSCFDFNALCSSKQFYQDDTQSI